ncbi:mitochondrial 54S ribosomal protein uL30m [Phyllosticta citriasiana]|uniref:Large ribosomal subunit protein uL30m n=1 Tax=Phyllosticta citriasiana TaxID=595635 RepID=A0ABR1KRQ6_9PEZI
MAYFKITLLRSAIALPSKVQGTLAALGLRKRMSTVYHPVTQSVAGKIMRVKELVDVLEVDKPLSKAEQRALRKPDPGYFIEKRASERA